MRHRGQHMRFLMRLTSAKVQERLGHANVSTVRLYNGRKMRHEDSDVPTQMLRGCANNGSRLDAIGLRIGIEITWLGLPNAHLC